MCSTVSAMSNDTLHLTPHERVRVRRADEHALEVEVEWTPGDGKPPGHLHPHQDERFEVLAGVVTACVDGAEHRLVPGDALDIPAGAVHQMWNAGDEPARAIWETRPAGRTLEWFRALDAAGGAERTPTPLAMAPLLTKYRDVFRLSARPRSVVSVALALLAVVALVLPGTAQADSIAYVKNHNVWVADGDGSRQHQVTADGTASWGYRSPSQADDGTIVAARGTDIVRLTQGGKVLSTFDPPDTTDSAGQVIGGHPSQVAVSPDGRTVAFSYYQGNCPPGADCGVRYVTLTGPSDRAGSPRDKTFRNSPSFVANDKLLVFGGFKRQVNVDTPGGYDDDVHWFDDADMFGVENSTDLGDGELSRQGDRFVAVRSYGAKTHLMVYKAAGFAGPPAYACNTGNEETLDSPTWSPDGQRLAFAHKEGIEVLPLPSVEPDCPGASSGTVVIAGGSEPDWGPADVNPAQTTVTPGTPATPATPAAKKKATAKARALRKCKAKKSKRARKRCVRQVNRRYR